MDIREALGESGLLWRLNPRGKTRAALGAKLVALDHDWGYRWVMVTVTFMGHGLATEMAFTRDQRFMMTWSATERDLWSATGSVKEWRRYLRNRSSPDFGAAVRESMVDAYEVVGALDEAYFAA